MTRLLHPNIYPPLHLEVAVEAVEEWLAAGWLRADEAREPADSDHSDTDDHEEIEQ